MRWYIRAMSLGKKDIEAKLDEEALPLVQHIIKYFCYPDSDSIDHWVDEIYSFLNHVSRFKGSNKIPDSNFIFHSLWKLSIEEEFSIIYDNVTYDYGESKSDVNSTREKVEQYLHWLSDTLSKTGFSNKTGTKQCLEKLKDE